MSYTLNFLYIKWQLKTSTKNKVRIKILILNDKKVVLDELWIILVNAKKDSVCFFNFFYTCCYLYLST